MIDLALKDLVQPGTVHAVISSPASRPRVAGICLEEMAARIKVARIEANRFKTRPRKAQYDEKDAAIVKYKAQLEAAEIELAEYWRKMRWLAQVN